MSAAAGGFSEVQLAQDKLTGRTVALKIIFLNRPGLTAEQVLVLEHLSGGEMLQQLQRLKRYTEAHACQLFRQVVDVVAYLHSLGIMHRDIKPENCLLAKPAQHYATRVKPVKVKVIDLGMAGLYRPARPLYGCMGSPGFIAPEVVLGDAHTPAMDVYSLGVLLFVMLVGRKPWDSQRSHTLQYAVHATAQAPGLADPGFLALSRPVQQLLLAMLGEAPEARPSAAQVLQHTWVQQGAQGTGPDRLILPTVQQRLRMLGNSRQVMGTARGMLLLHSTGRRSGAVAFHKAVKEARLQLQQQAAALEAAGQLQQLQHQQHPLSSSASALLAADGALGSSNSVPVQAAAPASDLTASAPAATAATRLAVAAGQTANAPGAAGSADAAAAAQARPLGRKSATVGQLARASLTQQSLLFDGKRPPLAPTPAAAAAAAAGAARGGAGPAPAAAKGAPSKDSISNGSSSTAAAHSGAAATGPAGAVFAGCTRAVSPDAALGVMCDALERGMSVPNPEVGLLLSDGGHTHFGAYRAGRAVSVSPSALALLDADDRLCLLTAGTLGGPSWGARRGAADMAASFKQQYPARPFMRSITRLGQSLSSSLSRSLRHSTAGFGFSSSIRSGRFMSAATAEDGDGHAHCAGFERCPSTRCSQADDSGAGSPAAVRAQSSLSSGAGCGSGDLDGQLAEGHAEGGSRGAGHKAVAHASTGAAAEVTAAGNSSSRRAPAVSGITKASMIRAFAAGAAQAAAQLTAGGAGLHRGLLVVLRAAVVAPQRRHSA
ncbi:kinase-like domain-containing protein [Scenedesmus sp. NREL 46B-D3]|nr:kinase-like domain-containing protein [Scenedesmus sp. NREL 46B-D3]